MSRSYKKHPWHKYRYDRINGKRILHKIVRRAEEVPSGNLYRKLIERWDYIYDGKAIQTLNELRLDWNNQEEWTEDYASWDEVYREWKVRWKAK
ncbi:hypothetical protein IJT17_10670 [bacterium]|nr:hypothetical protein [bacterium]